MYTHSFPSTLWLTHTKACYKINKLNNAIQAAFWSKHKHTHTFSCFFLAGWRVLFCVLANLKCAWTSRSRLWCCMIYRDLNTYLKGFSLMRFILIGWIYMERSISQLIKHETTMIWQKMDWIKTVNKLDNWSMNWTPFLLGAVCGRMVAKIVLGCLGDSP